MQHLLDLGGLAEVEKINAKKANTLYNIIDSSNGFYVGHAKKSSRSDMNVSFTIPKDHALEPVFVEEALKEGMLGLKGHRHLGGIRASIYNAVSQSDVEKLGEFMREFARKHG